MNSCNNYICEDQFYLRRTTLDILWSLAEREGILQKLLSLPNRKNIIFLILSHLHLCLSNDKFRH